MTKIHWTTEKRLLKDLIPTSYNPRVISPVQYEALKKSLNDMGLAEIPAINLDTNQILAGHMRIKVLTDLYGKEHEIDVRVPDRILTKAECDRYLITSNKSGGEFNYDTLANFFEVDDLIEWGFSQEELGLKANDEKPTTSDTANTITLKYDSETYARVLEAFAQGKRDYGFGTNEELILDLLKGISE